MTSANEMQYTKLKYTVKLYHVTESDTTTVTHRSPYIV